jgi:hypothetical protein
MTSGVVTAGVAGFTSFTFTLADVNRWATRGATQVKGGNAGNLIMSGDQLATRLLGILAGTANDNNFNQLRPQFLAAGAQGVQDTADFAVYKTSYIMTQPFTTFMNKAAWQVATSLKCGYPVLGHSGGGPVAGFIFRMLALRAGVPAIFQGAASTGFNFVGFEEALSTQIQAMLVAYPAYQRGGKAALTVTNWISGNATDVPQGSTTWSGVIAPETTSSGYTPLLSSFTGTFWGWWGGAHTGVGMYPLRNGRAPNGGVLPNNFPP